MNMGHPDAMFISFLPGFQKEWLWLGILNFMDKFLHLDNSDLLVSLIPRPL